MFKATDAHGKSVCLHPLCSDVEKEWNQVGMKFIIHENSKAKCLCCRKGNAPGWAYVSSDRKYSLHVDCVMELIVRSWKEGRLDEAKMEKLENVNLAELAEQLEKKTGFPWKKVGIPLLKFVAEMVLGNPKTIGGLLFALLV
ncbi:uncharacterized protein LOC124929715 [Impatiens glandulifera]|uniref:uncharacterized protein LOC124929715 n=1 Tax=Impatiens glandulifera TaxID=253017 RepID=UPI001FB0E4DB|nr:uncharacterized protein LOC124929715 [Impatiens glandulifera]